MWIANWITSTQVRQKETVPVYCFTCACVCDDCLIQRRKSNYQRQLLGVTLHMGCNYSVKELWLGSDRQWLRGLITRELTAKIISRKTVSGKKVFRLVYAFVNPQTVMLANCCVCGSSWNGLECQLVSLHRPGACGFWVTLVATSHPASEHLRCVPHAPTLRQELPGVWLAEGPALSLLARREGTKHW